VDIIAHALWTTVAATEVRGRVARRPSIGWTVFWGVFPDLFSFMIPAVVRVWWYATGTTHSLLPDAHSPQHFHYVWQLYNCSHSLIVFTGVFALASLVMHRPVLELFGWALHILIDIPTHQGIFAIQFLWPVSAYAFDGIRWENRWFLVANYGLIVLMFGWLWLKSRMMSRKA
jgi:hypothetical protein